MVVGVAVGNSVGVTLVCRYSTIVCGMGRVYVGIGVGARFPPTVDSAALGNTERDASLNVWAGLSIFTGVIDVGFFAVSGG